jgi:ABC-type transporter Mla subunit MlaD
MSKQANHFRLGMFIIAAVAVFLVIVLALSAGHVLTSTVKMETYFNESVQGLDVGSAVKYRGVQIGRVTQVGFTAPRYQREVAWNQRKQYVLVVAEIDRAQIGAQGATDLVTLGDAVERGLRVRLASVGITGTAYLEIDTLDPLANPPLEIAWTPENAYIPSAPSTYNQIIRGMQRVLALLDEADIDRLVKNIATLARTVNDKIAEVPLTALSNDAQAALREARTLIARLDKLAAAPELNAAANDLAAAGTRLREVLANPDWNAAPTKAAQAFETVTALAENKNLQDALKSLERTLARLDTLTAGSDTDIAATLNNLRRASENLRDLTETTKRYPGGIFSEPPKPVVLPSR